MSDNTMLIIPVSFIAHTIPCIKNNNGNKIIIDTIKNPEYSIHILIEIFIFENESIVMTAIINAGKQIVIIFLIFIQTTPYIVNYKHILHHKAILFYIF